VRIVIVCCCAAEYVCVFVYLYVTVFIITALNVQHSAFNLEKTACGIQKTSSPLIITVSVLLPATRLAAHMMMTFRRLFQWNQVAVEWLVGAVVTISWVVWFCRQLTITPLFPRNALSSWLCR